MKTTNYACLGTVLLTVVEKQIIEGKITEVSFKRNEENVYVNQGYKFMHNGNEIELPAEQMFYKDMDCLNKCHPSQTQGFFLAAEGHWYFDGVRAKKYVVEDSIESFSLSANKGFITEDFVPEEHFNYEDDVYAYNTQTIHKDDGTTDVREGYLKSLLLTKSQRKVVEKFEKALKELESAGIGMIFHQYRAYYVNTENVANFGYYDEFETRFVPTPQLESSLVFDKEDSEYVTLELKK